jgi:RNA polymerase sigma factor (sigma-70 family)
MLSSEALSTTSRGTRPGVPRHVAAFDAFYLGEWVRAVRLATLLSGPDAAEDIAQDAFIAVRDQWSSIDNPGAYLRAAVANRCKNYLRWRALRRRRGWIEQRPSELGAGELWDALRALSSRQRMAVVLRFYGDLSLSDIAEVLGCREGTAASLVHRGVAELRRTLT